MNIVLITNFSSTICRVREICMSASPDFFSFSAYIECTSFTVYYLLVIDIRLTNIHKTEEVNIHKTAEVVCNFNASKRHKTHKYS